MGVLINNWVVQVKPQNEMHTRIYMINNMRINYKITYVIIIW